LDCFELFATKTRKIQYTDSKGKKRSVKAKWVEKEFFIEGKSGKKATFQGVIHSRAGIGEGIIVYPKSENNEGLIDDVEGKIYFSNGVEYVGGVQVCMDKVA